MLSFSVSNGSGISKNVIIFDGDMNSSLHIGNKKLSAEGEYSITFSEQHKKFY